MYSPTILSLGLSIVAILSVAQIPGSYGVPTNSFISRHGLIGSPLIVGGENIDIEKAPWQISLESFRSHTCGGAIVSEDYIVTAAHCHFIVNPYNTTLGRFFRKIRAGTTIQFPLIGWGGVTHNIERETSHPKWNRAALDYDIAIIKVAKKFEWSPKIKAALLTSMGVSDEFIRYNEKATATGWGLTKDGGWFPSLRLKSVDIELVPREECQKRLTEDQVTTRMICAGGNGKGGTCNGDSGGPLIQQNYLIGLTSWGIRSCNDPEYPFGFTNILNPEIRSFLKAYANV